MSSDPATISDSCEVVRQQGSLKSGPPSGIAPPNTPLALRRVKVCARHLGFEVGLDEIEVMQFAQRVRSLSWDESGPLEFGTDRAAQADPMLGVLIPLPSMPSGWRALADFVLRPAPGDWAGRHLRRTVEHALEPERAERTRSDYGSGWSSVVPAAWFLTERRRAAALQGLSMAAAALLVLVNTFEWIAADADGILGRIRLWLGTTSPLRWLCEPGGSESARVRLAGGLDGPGA